MPVLPFQTTNGSWYLKATKKSSEQKGLEENSQPQSQTVYFFLL